MKYLKLFENYINEGITFNIKDFGNETSIDANGNVTIYHRPDLYTILDICHAFKHVIFMKKLVGTIKREEFTYNDVNIEPDGGEAFKKTGIINLYLYKEFSDKERLTKIIEAIKEFANNHKLKLGKLTAEISNPNEDKKEHVKGEPITDIRVIRIPIIENGNEDEEFQHELHVGNGTAKRILRKMGFEIDDDEYVFIIPAKEIIKRANWAKGNEVDFDDYEIAKIFKNNKVNFYSGASNESDNEFIDTLVDMAQYAIKNGYDTIVGA
jgi:hypothetical protein